MLHAPDGQTNADVQAATTLRAVVLEQVGEGVIIADATGRITFVNEAANRLHGVADLGVPLSQWSDTYHLLTLAGDSYPPEELPLARALLRRETVRDALWRIQRPDGSEVVAQGTATPLVAPEGSPLGAVLVLWDVTALRESQDHYRYTVELNPQLPWTADPDGAISDFSQRWLDLTGLSREQALGGGWPRVPHPEDLPRIAEAWTRSVETGAPYDIEHRIRLADGTYRWMRSRAFPRRDERSGQIVRWYGSTEDIEERKQAELAREAMVAQQRRFLRDVLASVTEGRLHLDETSRDLPTALDPACDAVELSPPALRRLRQQVLAVTEEENWPAERAYDLMTAAHEAAMNAVVHAGGGVSRIHRDRGGDNSTGGTHASAVAATLQVWVHDTGPGIAWDQIHRAIERGFTSGAGFGHGFWLMLKSADRVHLLTDASGTTLVIEQDRVPATPPWLEGT